MSKLIFVGDIFLNNPNRVMPTFPENSIIVFNCEGPIVDSDLPPIKPASLRQCVKSTQKLFNASPDCRFIANLGNNHISDFGQNGVKQTKAFLSKHQVVHFGCGIKGTAHNVLELDNQTVLLSYCQHHPEYLRMVVEESEEQDGVRLFSFASVAEDIIQHGHGKNIVLYVHWGKEHVSEVDPILTREIQRLIDRFPNIKLVLGMHPHLIQAVTNYKKVPIFYSLGNYIFDKFIIIPPMQCVLSYPGKIRCKTKTFHRVFIPTQKTWSYKQRQSLIVNSTSDLSVISIQRVYDDGSSISCIENEFFLGAEKKIKLPFSISSKLHDLSWYLSKRLTQLVQVTLKVLEGTK